MRGVTLNDRAKIAEISKIRDFQPMFYNTPEIVVHYDIISMEQWYDRNWYYLSSRVAAGDLEWGIKVIRLERSAIESICRKYGICCLRNEAIVENRLRPLVLYRTLQATNQYSNSNTDIAVRWPKSRHRYWNSRAIMGSHSVTCHPAEVTFQW